MKHLPAPLAELLQRQRARLHEAAPDLVLSADESAALDRVLLASDYALERLCRNPRLVRSLDATEPVPVLDPMQADAWPGQLRRYRHAEAVRLIHRDVNGIDGFDATLSATSNLADRCTGLALDALHRELAQSHGEPRDGEGRAQRLVVFGLGKLGGAELNFSSDIDLVFAFPANGRSDGRRSLDNPAWFQRLGQRLIQLLGAVDAEGMVYRVDMRLRPFGQAGRLALSFAAMENYFQREGRDWERYAWIKARPVAGDLEAGMQFLASLRPFVYRRYLDFGAITGLREMKALIEAEVQRQERDADLKLGRGGIREVEFIVQLQQLIRGGREAGLRERGLLPALARLCEHGHVTRARAAALARAYRFLRQLENRLQMLREQQTHALPDDPLDRARLAWGLGFEDPEILQRELAGHRARVAEEFARVFEARTRERTGSGGETVARLAAIWRAPEAHGAADQLVQLGFESGAQLAARIREFALSSARAGMSARARQRLDSVLPQLLAMSAAGPAPDATAEQGLAMMHTILRRASYLALLDERPAALARLMDVLARSRWMAERLCAHPLLLDELLDARADARPPTRAEVGEALQQLLGGLAEGDLEARIHALGEFRQGFAFRVARAFLVDGQPASECTRQLAFVAEAVLGAVLPMAIAEVARRHGQLRDAGLAIVAYGSFGGRELGLESDLDLVFLHEVGDPGRCSDGARPLGAAEYHLRVVQKVVALLALPTPAGSLYRADLRLRPDGGKGPLVSSLESFSAYQRERAWNWEQLALVRARVVAGDERIARAFATTRASVLAAARDARAVVADALEMRQRMRAELDRSAAAGFDLKQGEGGLVDLEFLLQTEVLLGAGTCPELLATTRTTELLEALGRNHRLDPVVAVELRAAHAHLSARSLEQALAGRGRVVALDRPLMSARDAVIAAWKHLVASVGSAR